MKIFFFIIISLHGLIHLLGFLKAFRFAEINQLTQYISRPVGVLWLLSLLLLVASAIQFISNHDIWWITALPGVILSQILIISFWQDARFGTIPNVIIIIAAVVAFGDWNFTREVQNEISDMFNKYPGVENKILTAEMLDDLPLPVQKWLKNSGVVGKEMIQSVRLRQRGFIKMKPEQENWFKANAEQYFTINDPAFIWKVNVDIMPLIFFTGRDYFADGKGKLLIKILSLINIVTAADEKVNQGSLQRYLGETVWFPTAVISPYINWEEVDSLSAKATISYKGISGSAMFYFNNDGHIVKFSAMRYMGSGEDATLKEWVITLSVYQTFNGIKIPTKGEATWKLESGDFTWYKLEIYDVDYNKNELY